MTNRRLAAILAADVVGFSAMMEKDEEGTLQRLKTLQQDTIEPRLRNRGGRLFKTTGDGFLAEFASIVDAVRCALDIQEAVSSNETLRLRIGLNLGDVIVEKDGDIYGDGVNVAARLEQMAEPGGICISGSVYEQIERKLPIEFKDRGQQQVKNIARPVRVYAFSSLLSEPLAGPPSFLDRPSIVILPFANLSADPEQDYFVMG